MRRANLAKKIQARELVLGMWVEIPHPTIAETVAQSGFDFVILDAEHSSVSADALPSLLPPFDLHDMPVIFRVRWNAVELIKGPLDMGVTGLMVPMINSKAEAAFAAAASRYPPLGRRGIGPWRASNYYQNEASYVALANANIR